jgi:predicted transcriptional regulator
MMEPVNGAGLDKARSQIGRAALGLTENDLALAAGVSLSDIFLLESGGAIEPGTSLKIVAAFERAGVSFHTGPDGRPLMRVRTLDGIIEAPVTFSKG